MRHVVVHRRGGSEIGAQLLADGRRAIREAETLQGERVTQQLRLRRLAAPVATLQEDEGAALAASGGGCLGWRLLFDHLLQGMCED